MPSAKPVSFHIASRLDSGRGSGSNDDNNNSIIKEKA